MYHIAISLLLEEMTCNILSKMCWIIPEYTKLFVMLAIPWVPPSEVRVDEASPDLTLPGGRLCFRAAHWNCTRVSVKTEWGTSNLLSRELEVLTGLFHPNILLLMATTSSGPSNSLQLIFEHVSLGSLYQCLHVRSEPGLALLLNRVDTLLQVNDAIFFLFSSC